MPELVLSDGIAAEITRVAYATKLETGVRLMGIRQGDRYRVRHVIKPGPNAVERSATYQCDNDYAEKEFNRLLKDDPTLCWLGELHVHPRGYPMLSSTDRRTVREVMLGTDDCLHPDEFICGVMQRVLGSLAIHPVLFTRTNIEGVAMEVIYANLCKKPK